MSITMGFKFSKWVIADTQHICTNTSCKTPNINMGDLCGQHINTDGWACKNCTAEHFAELADVQQDLKDGGYVFRGEPMVADLDAVDTPKPGEVISVVRTITSFAYKKGAPEPILGTHTVDVRTSIRNPWGIKSLKKLTGLAPEVQSFVMRCPKSAQIVSNLVYKVKMNKRNLFIGCTGGKHRSVAVAELVAAKVREAGIEVIVVHRDL